MQEMPAHFQIFPTRSGAKSTAPFGFRSMGRLIENNARGLAFRLFSSIQSHGPEQNG
ncbi:hypothetical protein AB395_0000597 [Sinorhizobium fredii CCBAU 45436]|nr:hypothetical protein AB395_0000597 [Sinorhizobium fredii CCBAU 45436]